MDPFVFLPVLCLASNAFFMSYTNVFTMIAEKTLGKEDAWTPKHLFRYGVVYFAASILSMGVAIPYWQHLGML
jgi:hypothetical protein